MGLLTLLLDLTGTVGPLAEENALEEFAEESPRGPTGQPGVAKQPHAWELFIHSEFS